MPIGKDGALKKINTHEGFLFSWHTRLYRIPEDQYLIIILSNGGGAYLEGICANITNILYDRQPAPVKPLIAHYLYTAFKEKNLKPALQQSYRYFLDEKDNWDFSEYDLNHLGYFALSSDPESSVAIFKYVTDIFSQSWNAWDSYGEALAISGNKYEAIKAYEKSVSMNPNNNAGVEILKHLKGE